MALVRTDYTTASSVGQRPPDAAGWTTNHSFTLPAGSLVIVAGHMVAENSSSPRPTSLTLVVDGVITPTVRVTTGSPVQWGYGTRVWSFVVGATALTTTFTIKCGTDAIDLYFLEVYTYTGYDTTTPIGGTAIGTDADGTGAASITLSSAPTVNDETLSFCAGVTHAGQCPVVAGTGFTNLTYLGADGWLYVQAAVRTGSTTVTVPWSDVGTASGGAVPLEAMLAALVVRAPGAAGGTTYNQTCAGTAVSTGKTVKQVRPIRRGATTVTPKAIKQARGIRKASSTPGGTVVRTMSMTTLAASIAVASLSKGGQILLIGLTATANGVASMIKQVRSVRIGLAAQISAMTKAMRATRSATAGAAGSRVADVSATRAGSTAEQVSRAAAVSATLTGLTTEQASKVAGVASTRSTASGVDPQVTKGVRSDRSASLGVSGALSALRAKFLTLLASTGASGALGRAFSLIRSATVAPEGASNRSVTMWISAQATVAASMSIGRFLKMVLIATVGLSGVFRALSGITTSFLRRFGFLRDRRDHAFDADLRSVQFPADERTGLFEADIRSHIFPDDRP